MGHREVRRVPADWEHPKKDSYGVKEYYQPMYDQSYKDAAEKWIEGFHFFEAKRASGLLTEGEACGYYWDWDGMPPDEEYYRPDWPEESRTHYQMYQTTSEGTPISPVFADPEELAQWLFDNKAPIFGDITASLEEWRTIINGGVVAKEIAPNCFVT